ncbi:RimK family alpha-L-glutamate ligase [Candidatus Bathyarchaeota archaeon]|nr:MAG: RimK family alpha-L-glutamate ligase [Candidatus Bathyarchaeota archaeon]
MKFGLVTRNVNSWCSSQLIAAMKTFGIEPCPLSFNKVVARVSAQPYVSFGNVDLLEDLDAIIIRPIGRGSLEEIIFRMDMLHRLERLGAYILNNPSAIERSVDKFYTLTLLEEFGLPVPRTIVTEDAEEALKAFHELGGDIVLKPIFGSRGRGSTRISDPNVAERIFRAVSFHHQVLYLQEFIPHGSSDIRALVLGNCVIAAMRRVAKTWKTNVSQGATPVPVNLSREIEELSVRAAEIVGCELAGVDIVEGPKGPMIVEINSQPGWRGLQTTTSLNIAEEIIKYVSRKARG